MAHLSYGCHLQVLSSRHSDGLAICFGVGRCPLLEGRCLWPGQLWRGRSGATPAACWSPGGEETLQQET